MIEQQPSVPAAPETKGRSMISALVLTVGPLLLLAGVIVAFLNTSAGLGFSLPVPVEKLDFEHVQVVPDGFRLTVRNAGQDPVTIAQVAVDDAYWHATIEPSPTLARLGQATVIINYPWVEGDAHRIDLLTASGLKFEAVVPVAFESPRPTAQSLWGYTLIGIFVGIIPVFLGLMWFPALRKLNRTWLNFLLSLTMGLLIFLGVDATSEALELSAQVPGPFQGIGLVTIGGVVTFLLLETITQRQTRARRSEAAGRLTLAYMIALGIGLHNLGEGLAIGAAYVVGEASLGTFMVVGFIIKNITEGLAIIAPVLRDRPGFKHLILMGMLGGAPAILGAWIGGFSYSPVAATLFLAIGAGAVFEVAYEIARLMRADKLLASPLVNLGGITAGLLLMYITGIFVK